MFIYLKFHIKKVLVFQRQNFVRVRLGLSPQLAALSSSCRQKKIIRKKAFEFK